MSEDLKNQLAQQYFLMYPSFGKVLKAIFLSAFTLALAAAVSGMIAISIYSMTWHG